MMSKRSFIFALVVRLAIYGGWAWWLLDNPSWKWFVISSMVLFFWGSVASLIHFESASSRQEIEKAIKSDIEKKYQFLFDRFEEAKNIIEDSYSDLRERLESETASLERGIERGVDRQIQEIHAKINRLIDSFGVITRSKNRPSI